MQHPTDVIVIGAGLAGLMAAWRVAFHGKKVRVIAKGWGTTHWHSGCIDVLGYPNQSSTIPCESPATCVDDLIRSKQRHPYGLIGLERATIALQALQSLCQEANYPLRGSLDKNWLLPSAVGAVRPTCLAPEMMIAGDVGGKEPMLIVGLRNLIDSYASLAADNLTAQGIPAKSVTIHIESLSQSRFLTAPNLARLIESSDLAAEVAELVKPHIGDAGRIGFPAVLGLENPLEVKANFEAHLGRPVFEIPMLPPSVPGMRLHRILIDAISNHGGQVFEGMEVIGAEVSDRRVEAVYSSAAGPAARTRSQRAPTYILATGGMLGGGIVTDHNGQVRETILDLPLTALPGRSEWFKQEFFDREGHAINQVGIRVDGRFRPLDEAGESTVVNVHAAGAILAYCDALRERSHEGVAVTTGYWAGEYAATNG